jgi:DNA-binding LytR/AlgR family response regulator
MTAIIADDEKELRDYLRSCLEQVWPELNIVGEAENGREALALFEEFEPLIAFLDIRMPGLNGMDVAKRIGRDCWVVFVTAFDSYAVEAFEARALDYLLKPVNQKRLAETVERLKRRIKHETPPTGQIEGMLKDLLAGLPKEEPPKHLRWLKAPHGSGVRLISVEEVSYFQAKDKYTLVMTARGESLIRKSLKELSGELDPDFFWPVHRNCIVNVSAIAKVAKGFNGKGEIFLKNRSETLPVSRNCMKQFRMM